MTMNLSYRLGLFHFTSSIWPSSPWHPHPRGIMIYKKGYFDEYSKKMTIFALVFEIAINN